jgi:alanine dehydrogenase
MKIGVPKEIKNNEFRVGLVPASVRELTSRGHSVVVEADAGAGAGLTDAEYADAGAQIVDDAAAVFGTADLIVKVKEPQPIERAMLRRGQILFTYLHLAPDIGQARDLVASGAVCIAYETVTADNGTLPLLTPMSEVAGRMAAQVGAHYLERAAGGSGVLMGGVPGVAAANVVILGGGVSGSHAARIAAGMGARVTIVDRSLETLRRLSAQFGTAVETAYSTTEVVERLVLGADLVIGTVLIPGAAAPKLVTVDMVRRMRPGSVLVDVSIDQGGCFETSHATTHADPVFIRNGVVHYCVANMPGGVARTSTYALNNATLPFVLAIADKGWRTAIVDDVHLRNGLNVVNGAVVHRTVCEALALVFTPIDDVLAA